MLRDALAGLVLQQNIWMDRTCIEARAL